MYRGQCAAPSLPISDNSSLSPSDSIDLSPMENLPRRIEMDSKSRMVSGAMHPNNPTPWGLMSFYSSTEQPWVPLVSSGSKSQQGQLINPSQIQRVNNFGGWRSAQASECGTISQGFPPSDSGYESRAKHSIDETSVYDEMDRSQDTHSLTGHMMDLNPYQMVSENAYGRDMAMLRPDWTSNTTAPVTHTGAPDSKLICPVCEAHCKTKSELNKHNQRHLKAHKCDVLGCTRKEGFGTLNDLERHRSSVHPELYTGPRYRCRFGSCQTKGKLWPRADNFRSHLKRVHEKFLPADDDLGDFIAPLVQKEQQPLGRTVQEDLKGLGSDLGSDLSTYTLSWDVEEDVEIPSPEQPMDMDNLIDPSLETVEQPASDMSLGSNPMDVTAVEARVPQIVSQEPQDLAHPVYDLAQGHQYVRPGEISRSASERISGRTEMRSGGPQTFQSQVSVDRDTLSRKSLQSSGDSNTDCMDCDSLPNATEESSHGKSRRTDLLMDQSSLLSNPSAHALSEDDALKLLEKLPRSLIEKFMKTQSDVPSQGPASTPIGTNDAAHRCPATDCSKTFNRKCELKKHMKRHDKPYGCTFSGCKKKFGSKNDWKRHENSQHFQLEVWKCDEKRSNDDEVITANQSTATCGKVCHRRETFRTHLQREHKMNTSQVDCALDKCRVGRNCESRFWCGFCVQIIEITKKGANAWTERFNHIDNHYTGRDNVTKKDISEWKSVDPDLPEMDLNGSLDDSSDAESSEEMVVTPLKTTRKAPGPTRLANATESRKRTHEDDAEDRNTKRHRHGTFEERWHCCKCTWDAATKLHPACVNCSHRRCDDCQNRTTWLRD